MIPKTSSPETSGAIRARLADLRNRKAVLDQAIACLERYAIYCAPPGSEIAPEAVTEAETRLAGAA